MVKNRISVVLISLSIVVSLSAGCGGLASQPTPTNTPLPPTPTFTPIPPSSTPIPPTKMPTLTSTPTFTITPSPTATYTLTPITPFAGEWRGTSAAGQDIRFNVSKNADGKYTIENLFYGYIYCKDIRIRLTPTTMLIEDGIFETSKEPGYKYVITGNLISPGEIQGTVTTDPSFPSCGATKTNWIAHPVATPTP